MSVTEFVNDHTYTGQQYRFVVLPKKAIPFLHLGEPYIAISVSDSFDECPVVPQDENCKAVLQLVFDDIDEQIGNMALMTKDHARRIVGFVKEHSEVQTIVCQCSSGMSRSAGICVALMHWLEGYEDKRIRENHCPNDFVARMIIEAVAEDEMPESKSVSASSTE